MEQNKDEIPHIIHCCWLGRESKKDRKSHLAKRCRKSWTKHAKSWKICEWNLIGAEKLAKDRVLAPFVDHGELPPFVKAAIGAKKWAFAADWVRFAALYRDGGVYFDYDFKLVDSINRLIANGECTNGSWLSDGSICSEGSVLVMKRRSPLAKAMLEYYKTAKFDGQTTVGDVLSAQLFQTGIQFTTLDPEVLSPYDVRGKCHRVKGTTLGIHYYAMSWASPQRKIARWMSWHGMRGLIELALKARDIYRMSRQAMTLLRNWKHVKSAFSSLSYIYSDTSHALDALGGLTEPETEGLNKWLPDEGVFVEVGTLFGLTAVAVKRKHPNLRVIAVDNFSWNPFGLSPDIHAWFTHQILERSGVELVRCSSTEWRDRCLEDGTKIDAIFFDASHTYDDVKDECVWAKRQKIPLITGHDYNSMNPRFGVTRAVNEVFGTKNVETAGMCWRVK